MSQFRTWAGALAQAEAAAVIKAAAFGAARCNAASIRESLQSPSVHLLFAGVDKISPSGFLLWRYAPGEAEILSIGVLPVVRRMGCARKLLAEFLGEASRLGAEAAFLEVDATNKPARKLYTAVGFQQVGVRSAYYGNGADAVVLRMNIKKRDCGIISCEPCPPRD